MAILKGLELTKYIALIGHSLRDLPCHW